MDVIGACDEYRLFAIALRLFNSNALRSHIIAKADWIVWDLLLDNFTTADYAKTNLSEYSSLWPVDDEFYWFQWSHKTPAEHVNFVALAYELTGDFTYAAYAKHFIFGTFLRQVKRFKHSADWRFTWIKYGSMIPPMVWVISDAMKRSPADLAKAEDKWLSKRAASGNPVYTGSGVDFEKDSMDSSGNITNRPPVDLPREGTTRIYGLKDTVSLGVLSTEDHS